MSTLEDLVKTFDVGLESMVQAACIKQLPTWYGILAVCSQNLKEDERTGNYVERNNTGLLHLSNSKMHWFINLSLRKFVHSDLVWWKRGMHNQLFYNPYKTQYDMLRLYKVHWRFLSNIFPPLAHLHFLVRSLSPQQKSQNQPCTLL